MFLHRFFLCRFRIATCNVAFSIDFSNLFLDFSSPIGSMFCICFGMFLHRLFLYRFRIVRCNVTFSMNCLICSRFKFSFRLHFYICLACVCNDVSSYIVLAMVLNRYSITCFLIVLFILLSSILTYHKPDN